MKLLITYYPRRGNENTIYRIFTNINFISLVLDTTKFKNGRILWSECIQVFYPYSINHYVDHGWFNLGVKLNKTMKSKNTDMLRAIFEETTNGLGADRRYIARSYTGKSGWGVYDVVKGEFLSKDLKELNESNFRDLITEV